jgi:hypothetical protein
MNAESDALLPLATSHSLSFLATRTTQMDATATASPVITLVARNLSSDSTGVPAITTLSEGTVSAHIKSKP